MTRRAAIGAAALLLGTAVALAQEPTSSMPELGSAVGAPRGPRIAGAALEARTRDVASLLRCPVCQGLSVADSPASMALKMKAEVREMLAAGYDQDQILAYFESSYGEFVRLKPPLRGVNWLVWVAPLLGLAAGGGIVAWALRGPHPPATRETATAAGSASAPSGLPDPDTLPDDPALVPYVLKARELAYGWPGGVRPRADEF